MTAVLFCTPFNGPSPILTAVVVVVVVAAAAAAAAAAHGVG